MRAVCTTTDRRSLPALSTWYLTTNLPVPLAENVRLYGLRNWVEQGYKQMKDELGWADFMVRCDRAIHRHWTLVCCAFTFCWCLPNPCESVLGTTRGGGKNQQRQGAAVQYEPTARGARVADPRVIGLHAAGPPLQTLPRQPSSPRCLAH